MSRSFDSTSLTTLPSMAMVPASISSNPASMRNSVDLPHPDGPTSTMNSPSLMSKLMPWITLVGPKLFSMPWNDTDAMFSVPKSDVANGRWRSGLHRARGQPADHVALECIVDGSRRQRVNESDSHQQFPGRIVGSEKVSQRDRKRDLPVIRQQQERVQIFVPRKQ